MQKIKIMENLLVELKKYFASHTREQILKDWEATAEYDSVGVLCCDFVTNVNDNIPKFHINADLLKLNDNYYSPKEFSGFFYNQIQTMQQ